MALLAVVTSDDDDDEEVYRRTACQQYTSKVSHGRAPKNNRHPRVAGCSLKGALEAIKGALSR